MINEVRMTNFTRVEDKSYYTFNRMNEYAGDAFSFYVHSEGVSYEYLLGNYKGALCLIRCDVDAEEEVWEVVGYAGEQDMGDFHMLSVTHRGNGVITVTLEEPFDKTTQRLRLNTLK